MLSDIASNSSTYLKMKNYYILSRPLTGLEKLIQHTVYNPATYFFLTSLLEYNCFTMVCQFLLYNTVNQLYIYIYPHISSLFVSLPPSLSHPSRWSQSTKLISLCYVVASHQLAILHLVVKISPCLSYRVKLSQKEKNKYRMLTANTYIWNLKIKEKLKKKRL